MPSFDIVSEVSCHELDNAINQANREITNRFDFKGTDAKIVPKDNNLTLYAPSKFQVQQIYDILTSKMAKRGINTNCLATNEVVETNHNAYQEITVQQGIGPDLAKKITTLIKASKLKLQTAIQGGKIRVTGKKKDGLQDIMQSLKEEKLDLPLQFVNFRD